MATASGVSIHSRRSRTYRRIAAASLCALTLACSSASYDSPTWSARVVDMESGAPIEGAIVVARWQLERYGGAFAGWLHIAEAVTNEDGVFVFPAWGPTSAPSSSGHQTRMSPNVPDISIFKSGYQVEDNDCCSDTSYLNAKWNYGSGPSKRESWANQRTFAIAKFDGTDTEYREHLERFFTLAGPQCAYLSIPQIFAAAIREHHRLEASTGIGIPYLSVDELETHHNSGKCAVTVRQAVGRYL